MAPVDLERFRAGYLRSIEAMHAGDQQAAFGWIPPDFEWHVLADALPEDVRVEAPPVLRGAGEVIAYFAEMLEDWEWRPVPQEFVDPGDGTIVVHSMGDIRGRASGLVGQVRFTQTWEFREDGFPMRVRERLDDYFLKGTR